MKQTTNSLTYRILDFAFAALTILLAALLIAQCADIYFTGKSASNLSDTGVLLSDIYSREIIAAHFSRISWALWLWLAVFAAELILPALMPRRQGAAAVQFPPENRLALRLKSIEMTPAMEKEERLRRTASWVCAAVCLVCAGLGGGYVFNRNNFTSRDLEPVMGAMLRWIVPFVVVAFSALMVRTEICRRSMLRELEAAKTAPKRELPISDVERRLPVSLLRIALYAAAVVLIIAGISNGGMRDVLVKAVNICTECVGLG